MTLQHSLVCQHFYFFVFIFKSTDVSWKPDHKPVCAFLRTSCWARSRCWQSRSEPRVGSDRSGGSDWISFYLKKKTRKLLHGSYFARTHRLWGTFSVFSPLRCWICYFSKWSCCLCLMWGFIKIRTSGVTERLIRELFFFNALGRDVFAPRGLHRAVVDLLASQFPSHQLEVSRHGQKLPAWRWELPAGQWRKMRFWGWGGGVLDDNPC